MDPLTSVRWSRLINRGKNHAILLIDSLGVANQEHYAEKIFGVPFHAELYAQFDGSRWISEQDLESLKKALEQVMLADPRFLLRAAQTIEELSLVIIDRATAYQHEDWKKATDHRLVDVLSEFHGLIARLWGGPWYYGWYTYLNDIYLERFSAHLQQRLTAEQFTRVWEYLLQPERLTFIGQERRAALQLAKSSIHTKQLSLVAIEGHLAAYAFVNKYMFWGDGMTAKQLEDQIADLWTKGEEFINQELKSLELIQEDLAAFGLTDAEQLTIRGFKKFSYAANLTEEAVGYYTFRLRPLFNELAARLHIVYEEFVSMRLAEIVASINAHHLVVPQHELQERYGDHALIYAEGETMVVSGEAMHTYQKQILQSVEDVSLDKTLKGTAAYKVNQPVRATVTTLAHPDRVASFPKGHVLVTTMTNPAYLPAMKLAAAIITDEGGLLCHAAITARELGIPCVIGTKSATKMLHNGDEVEIDTQRATVTIIRRAD